MKGLLIYSSTGAKRNRWFIERLLYNFKQKGINLELVITDNSELGTINNVDFAIVRVAAPEINKSLENFGVRVFNNFNTSYIANNKWETYLLCKRLGIPTMPTYHNLENKELYQFPCVLKSDNGHGGSEVFWVNNVEEFLTIERQFQLINKNFVIQKPSSELGKDMRIYLMGQEIVSSVLRYNPNDFKSNYSLGGEVHKITPTSHQINIAKKIATYLNSDYIGVDFLLDNGEWVLNEIEDVVGSRMLYKVTDIDVASKYCSYIEAELN